MPFIVMYIQSLYFDSAQYIADEKMVVASHRAAESDYYPKYGGESAVTNNSTEPHWRINWEHCG